VRLRVRVKKLDQMIFLHLLQQRSEAEREGLFCGAPGAWVEGVELRKFHCRRGGGMVVAFAMKVPKSTAGVETRESTK